MVSEVEEVAEGAIVILYMLFEICVNLFKLRVCKRSFRVKWIKEICNLIDKKKLLVPTACLVFLVNACKLNTINRYCSKIGFYISCKHILRISNLL
jgi:hypothetical protein